MRVVTVVGARPQFVKAAIVSKALHKNGISEVLVHTGQHFDSNMSNVFFDELEIPKPDYNLGIGGGSHGENTGRMIEAIEKVLLHVRPDWVLVYGDTDSTLAGGIAAVKLNIPIAHVEAGLRSFNRRMPEEVNRVLVDHVASLLFAPTDLAIENLLNEGVDATSIKVVGDVMYDAALFYGSKAETLSDVLERTGVKAGSYVLSTIHRAENTDDPRRLSEILNGFGQFNGDIVFPLHPRTRSRLASFNIEVPQNIHLIDPVGYLDMLKLEKNACLVATDSGGVQKEAFFFRVPCVTLRGETEWTELVDAGWNRLVPPLNADFIAQALSKSLGSCGETIYPYGDGDASEKIAGCLCE